MRIRHSLSLIPDPSMFLGYNTNGLAHHDLFDAVELLAEIGYRGVAITIDHNALPPDGTRTRTSSIATAAAAAGASCGMRSVIETGARFLLDPRAKHEPTLLSDATAARRHRLLQVRHRLRRRAWAAIASRSGRACFATSRCAARRRAMERLWSTGCAKCSTTRPSSGVADRLRAGAGHVDRLRCQRSRQLLAARSTPSELAADARHRPSALPGRNADRRGDPPLGAAAGQRPHRRHARAASTST